MKTATLLVAALFATATLVALAPDAAATNRACTYKSSTCPGLVCAVYDDETDRYAVCVGGTIVCVREPCHPYPLP